MKFLTLNLRHDTDRWPERRGLVLDELCDERPDVIAFQEVAVAVRQAHDIAEALNARLGEQPYQVFFQRKWQPEEREGIALLSRLPVAEHEGLDLPEDGGRVAQRLRVDVDGRPVDIANTHLHHRPVGDESVRLAQVRRLLDWMRAGDAPRRWLLAGDFNATPDTATIKEVERDLRSAYRAVHGAEPERTFPTPMAAAHDHRAITLDYVFFDPARLRVDDARVIGARPHPEDPGLYPSDHFGLAVEVSVIA